MNQIVKVYSLHAGLEALAAEIQVLLDEGCTVAHMTSETGRLVVVFDTSALATW